ncbi:MULTISPECIES: hypothetical protein [Pseudomonas]|uniref:hypothetical protein n=1 Tax=Pseudomonas TaxID=286 RepID=UPI0018E7082E|nr:MULTISPECIES: hypothetical protein [Pseudomonas]MBJ2215781.1 hypothetical protein [Pseudomonas carnis]MBP5948046.1 hypothetical protein [Pseudomonas sp. P9(2020)]
MQDSTNIKSGRKVLIAALFGSLVGATIGGGGVGFYLAQKSEMRQMDWMDSVAAMNLRVDKLASAVEQSNYHDKQAVLRTSGVNAVRGPGGTLTDSQLDAAIKGVFDSSGLPADEAMSGASEPVRIEDSVPEEHQAEKLTDKQIEALKAYSQNLKDLAAKFAQARATIGAVEQNETPAAKE